MLHQPYSCKYCFPPTSSSSSCCLIVWVVLPYPKLLCFGKKLSLSLAIETVYYVSYWITQNWIHSTCIVIFFFGRDGSHTTSPTQHLPTLRVCTFGCCVCTQQFGASMDNIHFDYLTYIYIYLKFHCFTNNTCEICFHILYHLYG